MLTELGKRIDEQSDNFNKALETMRKKTVRAGYCSVAQSCPTLWAAA